MNNEKTEILVSAEADIVTITPSVKAPGFILVAHEGDVEIVRTIDEAIEVAVRGAVEKAKANGGNFTTIIEWENFK
jgi:hypothetical protein